MKKIKVFFLFSFCTAGTILILYTIAWFVTAEQIKRNIEETYISATRDRYSINLSPLVIDGFPGPFRLRTAGNIQIDNINLVIPSLVVQSFLIPGWPANVIFENGLSASGAAIDETLSRLDYLSLRGPVPRSLPEAWDTSHLRAWQAAGGVVTIDHFGVKKESLLAEGNGHITIDETLQPAGIISTTMAGHIEFLTWLAQKNMISQKQAMITATILSGFSKTDSKTGAITANINIQVGRRVLSVGPIPLATLPFIDWP